jgi:hypothetical protein
MQQDEKSESFPPALATNRVRVVLGINDLGGAMLRLTFLLCAGLFLALLIGGRDYGQMRPGLAQAEAKAEAEVVTADVSAVETVVLASDVAPAAPVVEPEVAVAAVEPEVAAVVPEVVAVVPEVVAVVPEVIAPVLPAAEVADVTPVPEPAAEDNGVFTLSNYADPVPETTVVSETAPEPAGEGEIWYADGSSVNVRAGPSTDDEVVGKLSRGEATLVVWREGEDWARIRIEGDGIEGYVATRFLTAEAPSFN